MTHLPASQLHYTQNRFYQAIDALATISAKSAEECAGACNADERCEIVETMAKDLSVCMKAAHSARAAPNTVQPYFNVRRLLLDALPPVTGCRL